MNQQANPYTCPIVFFPADSKFPQHGIADSPDRCAVPSILRAIIRDTDELRQLLELHIVGWPDVGNRLARLGQLMAYTYTFFESEVQTLATTENRDTSTEALKKIFHHRSSEIVAGYAVWDRYFRVIRVPALPTQQFMAQVIKTSMEMLYDLPYTVIERAELAYLMRMLNMIFSEFYEQLHSETHEHPSAHLELPLQIVENWTSWSTLWSQSCDPDERDQRIGLYRWKVGHHFFIICAIFCQKVLAQASDAFEADHEARGVQSLHDARLFLRGTTAAMWYANNFPLEIYTKYVRQSMIDEEALSGEEMIDYNSMKDAIDCLEKTVFKKYGRDFNNWPEAVYSAYHEFGQIYVEDMEHHVLIAISKVGSDTSLAQKAWQGDVPKRYRKKTAADVLRDMMDLRRKRFGLL